MARKAATLMPRLIEPITPTCPATEDFALQAKTFFGGLDGCPDGWILCALPPRTARRLHYLGFRTFRALLAWEKHRRKPADRLMVDMPIGLPDSGRRVCETMARRMLGKRASSVFPAPRRPMLAFQHYAEANAWGKKQGTENGGGLSKQAWMLVPKIRELDAALTPGDQNRICEAHPEIAFCRLNTGLPCGHNKKTREGRGERLTVLREALGLADLPDYDALRADFLKQKFRLGVDDLIDATVLAVTARDRHRGRAICLGDGSLDRTGKKIEIWG